MMAGEPVRVAPSGIAADSLGASLAGTLMFPIAKAYVDSVALVSDADIRIAQRYLWESIATGYRTRRRYGHRRIIVGKLSPGRERACRRAHLRRQYRA